MNKLSEGISYVCTIVPFSHTPIHEHVLCSIMSMYYVTLLSSFWRRFDVSAYALLSNHPVFIGEGRI